MARPIVNPCVSHDETNRVSLGKDDLHAVKWLLDMARAVTACAGAYAQTAEAGGATIKAALQGVSYLLDEVDEALLAAKEGR